MSYFCNNDGHISLPLRVEKIELYYKLTWECVSLFGFGSYVLRLLAYSFYEICILLCFPCCLFGLLLIFFFNICSNATLSYSCL